MNHDKLAEIIALGEGNSIEFKRSAKDLGSEICAFANSSGGRILLGVADSGEVVGVSDDNKLRSQIQTTARSAEPPITIELEPQGSVICIHVPPQRRKPYSFGGKFYVREGANTQQMSRDEIRNFFHEEDFLHFDESVCHKFSLDEDLDEENWRLFSERAKIPREMAPEIALRNLRLINREAQITNAGAWLLAKDIRKFNIGADVSCGLFMGSDKIHILDRRDFHGDIYSMINDTIAWILSKINVAYIIKKLQRDERPELPEEAIREAVANAFAHRNYRSTANIQIYLFSDRLEIVSPGGLPAGMTESDLGSGSIPRNPLLFSILHRMNAVEHIGSGIARIRDLCREHGVAKPMIRASDSWVTVTFLRSVQATKDQTSAVSGQESPQVGTRTESSQDQDGTKMGLSRDQDDKTGSNRDQDGTKMGLSRDQDDKTGSSRDQDGTKSGLSRDQDETKIGLSQNQIEIIRKCENEKTAEELMQAVGRSNRSKFRGKVLKPLMQSGLLEMTIPDKPRSKNQRYRLTENGKVLSRDLQKQNKAPRGNQIH